MQKYFSFCTREIAMLEIGREKRAPAPAPSPAPARIDGSQSLHKSGWSAQIPNNNNNNNNKHEYEYEKQEENIK